MYDNRRKGLGMDWSVVSGKIVDVHDSETIVVFVSWDIVMIV